MKLFSYIAKTVFKKLFYYILNISKIKGKTSSENI